MENQMVGDAALGSALCNVISSLRKNFYCELSIVSLHPGKIILGMTYHNAGM